MACTSVVTFSTSYNSYYMDMDAQPVSRLALRTRQSLRPAPKPEKCYLSRVPIEVLIYILQSVYDSIIIRDKSEFLALSVINKTFYQIVYEILLEDVYLAGKDSLDLFSKLFQKGDSRKRRVKALGLWCGDFEKLAGLMAQLPELSTLSICNTSLIRGLGQGQMTLSNQFPKLKEINLSGIAGGAYAKGNLPTLPQSLLFTPYTTQLRALRLSYLNLPKIDDFPTVEDLTLFCVDGPKEAFIHNFSKSSKTLKSLRIGQCLRDANLQEFLDVFSENLLHLQLDINDCKCNWEDLLTNLKNLMSLDLWNLEHLPPKSFGTLPKSLQFLSIQFRFLFQDCHFRLSQRLVVCHSGAKKGWQMLLGFISGGGLPNLKYFREVGMPTVLEEIKGLKGEIVEVCEKRGIEFSNIKDDSWDVLLENALKNNAQTHIECGQHDQSGQHLLAKM